MDNTTELKPHVGTIQKNIITGIDEIFDGKIWIPLTTSNLISTCEPFTGKLVYNDSIGASISTSEPSYDFILEMISKLSLEELQRLYAKKEHLITLIEKLILLKN